MTEAVAEKEQQHTNENLRVDSTSETVQEEKSMLSPCGLPDKYEVLAEIGSGGMGTVYRVKDQTLNRILSVKVLRSDFRGDSVALKRFEKEVATLSKLTHPNIVAIYDHGMSGDQVPYLVMEHVDGVSLRELLESGETLSEETTIELFLEICDALEAAHSAGVIHRDLKPSNIIVDLDRGKSIESVKIVDFGIARLANESVDFRETVTKTGELIGTPLYMSPEQCVGESLDKRSDIYSFGCIMFEMLTGKPPFEAANPIQIILKQLNDEPPRLQAAGRSARAIELEKIVSRCLEKKRNQRYDNVEQLLKDVATARSGGRVKYDSPRKRQVKDTLLICLASTVIGVAATLLFAYFYKMSNNRTVASQPSVPAFPKVDKDQNKLAGDLNQVAFYHFREGSYSQALPLLEYVAETTRRVGNKPHEAFCYQCIAQCHLALKNHDEALKWYRKSLDLFDTIPYYAGIENGITEAKTGYLETLRKLGRDEEAQKVLESLDKKQVEWLYNFYKRSGVKDADRVGKLLDSM